MNNPVSIVTNEDNMQMMARYPDGFFDLAVCDVPYGINVSKMAYTQEEIRPCKQKNGQIYRVKKLAYKHGDWDSAPPPQAYFDELRRVSKNQIIFGVEYVDWTGLGIGRIKWDKCVPEGVSFKGYEMAYCSLIDYEMEIKLLWAGMCQAKSLKEPTTQQGNKKLNEKRIHPCHKPIMLYKKLISLFSELGDKILDTHLGSGSSRIAAYQMGFDFYGCELDMEYFNEANKRFKIETMQTSMFAFNEQI